MAYIASLIMSSIIPLSQSLVSKKTPPSSPPHYSEVAFPNDKSRGPLSADSTFWAPSQSREQPILIEIVFDDAPHNVICRDVPLDMLHYFGSAKHIDKYLVTENPGDSPYLSLPAIACEAIGVRTTVACMRSAYSNETRFMLSRKLKMDLLTLCCVQRALYVLGNREECKKLRNYIEQECFAQTMSVTILKPIWERLPRNSYWVKALLRKIQEGIIFMEEHWERKGFCYCGSRSWLHDNCLLAWLETDAALREAVTSLDDKRERHTHDVRGQCTYKSRGMHAHKSFASRCSPKSATRIKEWVLNVEDSLPLPLGFYPTETALVGDTESEMATQKRLGPINGEYQLEWS